MTYHRWLVAIILTLLLGVPLLAQETESETHIVQSGENLFRIALRYGMTTQELATANSISDTSQIYAGQVLVIPGLEAVDTSDDVANPLVATAPITHIVERGQYLGQIAELYGVSVADILSANNITNANTIYAGQSLQIWSDDVSVAIEDTVEEVAETAAPDTSVIEETGQEIVHIVQRGEYLSSIARQYGMSWTVLAEFNGITNPNDIDAGTALRIPNTVSASSPLPVVETADGDPGPHWGFGREIVVDLSTQMTYAYEDGNLVFSSLVSTGLPATPTVQGEYQIWHRTPAQTMTGPGYNLPNVQWVQYFYQGYGFHGTYWHSNFGNPMSHGCVNMTNEDAEWLYNFGSIGMNVWVQY